MLQWGDLKPVAKPEPTLDQYKRALKRCNNALAQEREEWDSQKREIIPILRDCHTALERQMVLEEELRKATYEINQLRQVIASAKEALVIPDDALAWTNTKRARTECNVCGTPGAPHQCSACCAQVPLCGEACLRHHADSVHGE